MISALLIFLALQQPALAESQPESQARQVRIPADRDRPIRPKVITDSGDPDR